MIVDLYAGRLSAVSAFIAFLAGFWWLFGDPEDIDSEDYAARYAALMSRNGRPICLVAAAVSVAAFVVWLVVPSR